MTSKDEERELRRDELRAMYENTGRFGLMGSGDRWRVIEFSRDDMTEWTLRSDWMDHASALAERDRLFKGGI